MELKLFFNILKKNIYWWLVPLILIPLAMLLFSFMQKPGFQAIFSITAVPTSAAEEKSTYETLRATSLFTNTIRTWLHNQDIVSEILIKAGENPNAYSSKQMQNLFKTQFLENTFTLPIELNADSQEKAEKIANATIGFVKQKTKEFNQSTQGHLTFQTQAPAPYIKQQESKLKTNLLLGLAAGLFLGLFLALSKHYIET